jgi:predicted Zn-dependent peptidase
MPKCFKSIPLIVLLAAPAFFTGCNQRKPVEEVVLENGLHVVFTRMQCPITSAVFLLDYGEVDGPPGLARLTNQALLKGNAIRNGEQIYEEIEGSGGYLDVETGLTSSIVGVRSPSANFEDCFQIVCECLSLSTFDSTELARIDTDFRGVDQGRKNGLLLTRQAWKDEGVRSRLFPESALGRPLFRKASRYGRNDVTRFAARHLRPDRVVLSVAGPCSERQILDMARNACKAVKDAPAGQPASSTAANEIFQAPKSQTGRGNSGARDLAYFAVRGAKAYSDTFLTEYLALTAITGEKQRSFVSSLDAEGIHDADFDFYSQSEAGYAYSVIQVSVPAGMGSRVPALLSQEFEMMSRTGVSPAAIRIAKRRFESAIAFESQYALQQAFFSARAARMNLPFHTLQELLSRVQSITPDDVNRSFGGLMSRSQAWAVRAEKR